jgi:hypothetical protein
MYLTCALVGNRGTGCLWDTPERASLLLGLEQRRETRRGQHRPVGNPSRSRLEGIVPADVRRPRVKGPPQA